MVLKRELAFFALVIIFGLSVSLFVFLSAEEDIAPLTLTIRMLALNGFIALSIAVIMTPFLKEVTLFFKKSFTKIHHYFAATGLFLITLHPIAVFTQTVDPTIFLPNFESLYLFFFFGGIIALLLIYVSLVAVLMRRKIPCLLASFPHANVFSAVCRSCPRQSSRHQFSKPIHPDNL